MSVFVVPPNFLAASQVFFPTAPPAAATRDRAEDARPPDHRVTATADALAAVTARPPSLERERRLASTWTPDADRPATENFDLELSRFLKRRLLLAPRETRLSSRDDGAARPATHQGNRTWMALKIGETVARSLNMLPQDHTPEELAALGECALVDRLTSGVVDGSPADARLGILFAAAQAAGGLDDASIQEANPTELAERLNAFIQAKFSNEIAFCEAMEKLAALEMPTRLQVARDLLTEAGLNPHLPVIRREYVESRLSTAVLNHASTPEPITVRPAERYFSSDKLDEADLALMWTAGNVPPTPEQASDILARLPASLDSAFNERFDAYARSAATHMSTLLCARLALHAQKNGIDLSGATISVYRPTLEYYANQVFPLRGGAIMYEGKAQAVAQAEGYVFSVRSADSERQFFLSLKTGLSQELLPGASPAAWVEANRATVFGAASPLPTAHARLRTRVAIEKIASSGMPTLSEELSASFRNDIEKARDTARGQTPQEQMVDFLLNLIPFRSMIVAIRRGDVESAIMAGGFDILALIPLLALGGRLANLGVKVGKYGLLATAASVNSPRLTAATAKVFTTPLMTKAGMRNLSNLVLPLREAIREKLARGAAGAWTRIMSLDPERMAVALRTSHPSVANSLQAASRNMRGATVADGWWRVSDLPAPMADDAIRALSSITAHDALGASLPLLQYGGLPAYTQYDPASGARLGALLLAGQDHLLYRSLPLDTVQRYRVAASDPLRQLEGLRANANGTITLQDRTYARIGDDYIEVAMDHATSTAGRPIWHAVPPESVSPDTIVHRIAYDADQAVWRQAAIPELDGGGARPSRASTAPASIGTPSTGSSSTGASPARTSSAGAADTRRDSRQLTLRRFSHDVQARHHNLVGHAGKNYFVQGADDRVRRFAGGYSGGTVTPELLDGEFVRSLDRIMDYSHAGALGEVMAGYSHDTAQPLATYHVENQPVPSLDPAHGVYPIGQAAHAQYMISAGDQLGDADACAQMLLAEGKTPEQVAEQLIKYRELRLRFPRTGDPVNDTVLRLSAQLKGAVASTYTNNASHEETIVMLTRALAADAPVILFRKGQAVVLDAIETGTDVGTGAQVTWLTIRHPVTASKVRIRDHQEFWTGDDRSLTVTPPAPDTVLEDIRIITIEHDHRLRHLRRAASETTH